MYESRNKEEAPKLRNGTAEAFLFILSRIEGLPFLKLID